LKRESCLGGASLKKRGVKIVSSLTLEKRGEVWGGLAIAKKRGGVGERLRLDALTSREEKRKFALPVKKK